MLERNYAASLDDLCISIAEALGRAVIAHRAEYPDHRAALDRIKRDLSSAIIDARQIARPF